jgi:hypothetical protein
MRDELSVPSMTNGTVLLVPRAGEEDTTAFGSTAKPSARICAEAFA